MSQKQRYYWLGSDEPSSQDTFFLEALDKTLWSPGTAQQWDTCWVIDMPDNALFNLLSGNKTINHVPGNDALTIKSELANTLNSARNKVSRQLQDSRYDFFPETYSMPEDYFTFQATAAKHPEYMWIQKPKNLSRGRGIEMVQHPSCVPLGESWMIQQYLANPHLYQGHKYVLRCYVLVTSVEPLRCYFYREGFAKLASESYSSEDLENPYRHLTNPDINEDNTNVEKPVTFLSFAQYRQWLADNGHDDEALFTSLKDLITLTIIAAREEMRTQSQQTETTGKGCYELIGLDCMVDDKLKPWILECNLSPSMDTYANDGTGGDSEVTIKRQLLADLVSIIGLNESDEALADFIDLPPAEKAVVESARSENFECLFPTQHANHYLNCFPVPRYADILSVPNNTTIDFTQINTVVNDNCEHLFDDSLAIFSNTNKALMLPNELASWIWLKNADGCHIAQITDELKQATACPEHMNDKEFEYSLHKQVWDVLADWSNNGVFSQTPINNDTSTANSPTAKSHVYPVIIADTAVFIRTACDVASAYLKPFLTSYLQQSLNTKGSNDCLTVDILRSDYGYAVLSNNRLVQTGCSLATLTTTLLSTIIPNAKNNSDTVLIQGSVVLFNGYHLLMVSDSTEIEDALSYYVEQKSTAKILSGAVKIRPDETTVISTNYPLYLPTRGDFSIKHNNENVVAMKRRTIYSLSKVHNNNTPIKIDAIIMLTKGNAGISPLTRAEIMSALWASCYNNNRINISANIIAQWLNHTVGFQLQCSNIDDALKELNDFKDIN